MLSDDAIDKLMKPIIERQENINNYVIAVICKRIKETGKLSASDIHRLERIVQMGADIRKINEEIARQTQLNVEDIKKLIRTVAEDSYVTAKPFYDYRHLAFIPFIKNEPLQRIVKAIEKQTLEEYKNISKAAAFMIRDLKNPSVLKPTSIAKTYQSVLDEAIQAASSGVVDYNTAMRRTLKQLSESGLRRVTYNPESGRRYTQRLDTALRRNLMDGIRAVNQGVQDEVGKQFGADGKELSAHGTCALDHEPVQGHQFTNEEYEKLQNSMTFQDVDGEKFKPIKRHIGQYNCRHFAWSIIVGTTKPTYTKEQLKDIIRTNHAGYTFPNGKHMTMYECTQYMRGLETKIRYAKEQQMAATIAGNIDLAQESRAKVAELTKQYKQFCKDCGLTPQLGRATISGYRAISVRK